MVSRHLVRLSSVLAVVLASLPAAEFLQNPADTGSNQNRVWIPDGVPAGEIQGVIVGFEYAFNPYGAAAWRDFCTQRKWALASLPSQDGMGGGSFWWSNVATDGLARLSTLLSQGATALGRPELATSTIPYVFVGLSRGGVLGAINLGWNAGAHKTVGIIAYHGSGVESNMGSYYPYPDQTTAIRAASSAIPVLYKIAQQDTTRQAQIEQVVHTDATRSLRLFYGCPWTTAMTYGAGHSNPGSDTYPLQWLGRVIDQRYDPATCVVAPPMRDIAASRTAAQRSRVVVIGTLPLAWDKAPGVGARRQPRGFAMLLSTRRYEPSPTAESCINADMVRSVLKMRCR